jgi:hypothetical protein
LGLLALALTTVFVACSTPPTPKACVITVSPATSVVQAGSETSLNIALDRSCGFSGEVGFSVDDANLYPQLDFSFDPQKTMGNTSTAKVKAQLTAALGTYMLTMRAFSTTGSESRSANFVLKVVAPQTTRAEVVIDPAITQTFIKKTNMVVFQTSEQLKTQLSEAIGVVLIDGKAGFYNVGQFVVRQDKGKDKDFKQFLKQNNLILLDSGQLPDPPKEVHPSQYRRVNDLGFRLVSLDPFKIKFDDRAKLKLEEHLAKRGLKGKVIFSSEYAALVWSELAKITEDKTSGVITGEPNWIGFPTAFENSEEHLKIESPKQYRQSDNAKDIYSLRYMGVSGPSGAWTRTIPNSVPGGPAIPVDGRGVDIAIIDAGFDPSNYDISGYDPVTDSFEHGRSVIGYDFTDGDYDVTAVGQVDCLQIPAPTKASSCNHGTATATLAAGTRNNHYGIAGPAPRANLQLFRVKGAVCIYIFPLFIPVCQVTLNYYKAAWAMNTAVAWGADVISMSYNFPTPYQLLWGACTPADSFCHYTNSAIDNAYNNNVVMIASAGNENSSTAVGPPADNLKVIAVGAVHANRDDQNFNKRENYSNYGSKVRLWAPGNDYAVPTGALDCYNTKKCADSTSSADEINGYTGQTFYFTGTSASAPRVAGIAALMKQINPSVTPASILTKLQKTSSISLNDSNVTAIVDAAAAVQSTLCDLPTVICPRH